MVTITVKGTSRKLLKKTDLPANSKHDRFDKDDSVLCTYDGCITIKKGSHTYDSKGFYYKPKCYKSMIKLSKEIFADMF